MAIRFPLEMANGKMVRELEEFQDNFDFQRAVEYFNIGKLQKWLEALYCDDILEKLETLTLQDDNFFEMFTEALGVKVQEPIDAKEEIHNAELKEKLQGHVEEDELESRVCITADTQEWLEKRLNDGCKTIYLFGERFTIPKTAQNIQFIGVQKTETVELEVKDKQTFISQNLEFSGVVPADEETRKLIYADTLNNSVLEFLNVLENYTGKLEGAR